MMMMMMMMLFMITTLLLINNTSSLINKNHNILIKNKNNKNINNNITLKSSSLPSSLPSLLSSLSLSSSLSKNNNIINNININILLIQKNILLITNQSKLSQNITLLLLSILTGSLTGYIIQILKNIINILEIYRINNPILIPILGTILIGYLYIIRTDLNIGPTSIYDNDDKTFSFYRQILRIIAITIAIGTGNAIALAGPAAELGMTFARLIGFGLLSTEESRRLLLLAGSAAGFSANFLAPISGVLFSMEFSNLQLIDSSEKKTTSLYKNNITKSLSFSMIASITSVIIARKGLLEPFKHFLCKYSYNNNIFNYKLVLLTSLIGISSGYISKLYRLSITKLSSILNNIPKHIKPLICGILCGIAAFYGFPQSLSKGFISLDDIVSGKLGTVIPLLSFFIIRLVMIVIANASGVLGGVVAPSIFIGAAYGVLMNLFFNRIGYINNNNLSSILSLIGGASFFSAFFKSPLTASMLIIEFTRNIDLVMPLLLATSLANIFS